MKSGYLDDIRSGTGVVAKALRAEGATIYALVHSGTEPKPAQTLKGQLKTWSSLDTAAKWVRSLGIGRMQLDVAKWQPEQRKMNL